MRWFIIRCPNNRVKIIDRKGVGKSTNSLTGVDRRTAMSVCETKLLPVKDKDRRSPG